MTDNVFKGDIKFRPFTGQDADLVFAFFERLSDQSRRLFHPHLFTKEVAEHLTGQDITNTETCRFLVSLTIDNQEVMIGYFFFWDWNTSVPLFGIAVADSYQGYGLGGKIMAYAIEWMASHGKGGILLSTDITNLRGQALYKRYGFKIIGENSEGEHLLIYRTMNR